MDLKKFWGTALLSSGLVASSCVWAIPISTVGGLDSFIESTTLGNSGDATEEQWVQSVLGSGISLDETYNSDGSDWEQVTGVAGQTDIYATNLSTAPGYFLLKLGIGGTSLESHYLFENNSELAWAVVDFSAAGVDFSVNNISIDRISHIGEFSSTVSVPEPSTLMLLGLGLMGVGAYRKRKI